MACFIVPAAEAVITSVVTKVVESKEQKALSIGEEVELSLENKLPLSKKIKWLSNLLWGGSALLAFEHVWHGEIEPFFPFLTAAKSSAEWTAALQEMSTAGVVMAVSVTLFWTGMVAVSNILEKHKKLTLQPVRKEQ